MPPSDNASSADSAAETIDEFDHDQICGSVDVVASRPVTDERVEAVPERGLWNWELGTITRRIYTKSC